VLIHAGCAIEVLKKDMAEEILSLFDELGRSKMKTLEAIKKELGEYEGKNIKIMEVCGTTLPAFLRTDPKPYLPRIQLISDRAALYA